MTPDELTQLAELLRTYREARQLSAREVARRAGVDGATVTLLERCRIRSPRIETLRAITAVLDIPLADLYATVHWLPEDGLPSLRPYMRAKYHDLPDDAVGEIEAFVARITKQHTNGPGGGEDEQ